MVGLGPRKKKKEGRKKKGGAGAATEGGVKKPYLSLILAILAMIQLKGERIKGSRQRRCGSRGSGGKEGPTRVSPMSKGASKQMRCGGKGGLLLSSV